MQNTPLGQTEREYYLSHFINKSNIFIISSPSFPGILRINFMTSSQLACLLIWLEHWLEHFRDSGIPHLDQAGSSATASDQEIHIDGLNLFRSGSACRSGDWCASTTLKTS